MAPPRLELTGVTKAFGGVHALRGVDFALRPGSIHGVAGENGAGKSTLMKIIAGVHAGDAGEMRIDGELVHFRSTRDARAAGIGMVHQELSVAPDLTVAENVFLGSQPVGRAGPRRVEADGARGRRAAEEPRPRDRPARASRRLSDRRAAARRTRARAVLRRADRHPGRADLRPFAARDRAAVRCAAADPGQRAQPRLHLAFSRRHPRDIGRGLGVPQRLARRHRRGRAGNRQELDHRAHDRRRPRGARGELSRRHRAEEPSGRAGSAGGARPDAGALLSRPLVRRPRGRGARASTASWAAGRSNSRARCSAS